MPWPAPFAWVPQAGRNFLIQPTIYGNSFGNQIWGYPFDAAGGLALAESAIGGVAGVLEGNTSQFMAQIVGNQQWGLGTIPGTRFKGGWGPSETGGYLVRQLGVIDTNRGQVAAAIAVQSNSGTVTDGIAQLSQVANWLRDHSAELPAGHCPD